MMFDPEREAIPSRVDFITTWLPRFAVAVVFVTVGFSKFRDPMWVGVFARIGAGQWFRYFTGVMQIAGGALTLVPKLSLVGIGMVACTMAGAVAGGGAFRPAVDAICSGTLLAIL